MGHFLAPIELKRSQKTFLSRMFILTWVFYDLDKKNNVQNLSCLYNAIEKTDFTLSKIGRFVTMMMPSTQNRFF